MVSSNCSTAYMIIVLMMIILPTILGINLATAIIKGAYIQIGQIQRDICVRSPKYCHRKRGMVYKLLKFPHVITDSFHKWFLRVYIWLLGDA